MRYGGVYGSVKYSKKTNAFTGKSKAFLIWLLTREIQKMSYISALRRLLICGTKTDLCLLTS